MYASTGVPRGCKCRSHYPGCSSLGIGVGKTSSTMNQRRRTLNIIYMSPITPQVTPNHTRHTTLCACSLAAWEMLSFFIWKMRWLIKLHILCRPCEVILFHVRSVDLSLTCESQHIVKVAAFMLHVEVGMGCIVVRNPFLRVNIA
jgi:hypothetical protein